MYVLLDTATSGSIIFQFGHHGRFLHQKLFVFQVFEWDNDVRNIPKLTGTIFQARVLKIRANVGDPPLLIRDFESASNGGRTTVIWQ